jgi:hypothetical protein
MLAILGFLNNDHRSSAKASIDIEACKSIDKIFASASEPIHPEAEAQRA